MSAEWRAKIDDDWMRNRMALAIWRNLGDGRIEVVEIDGVIRGMQADVAYDRERLIQIPADALEPLRDAIDHHMGRRYDESLVAELRAQLAAERCRVDSLLARIDTLSPPPGTTDGEASQ